MVRKGDYGGGSGQSRGLVSGFVLKVVQVGLRLFPSLPSLLRLQLGHS